MNLDIFTITEEDAMDIHETTCVIDRHGDHTCICLDWDKTIMEGIVWSHDEGDDCPEPRTFTNIEEARQYRNELIEYHTRPEVNY